ARPLADVSERCMSLADRYILREWLGILGLVLGACIGLLLMQTVYDDLRDLIQVGADVVDIVFYFTVKLPSSLSVVLPLALLLSLLYALGRLHRNLEITALRAAGLGVFRITRCIWAVGVLLCVVTWYLNATIVPWSVEEARSIWQQLNFRQAARTSQADRVGATTIVAFDNQIENRMWFMNRYSSYTGRGYGVTVSELTAERREKTRFEAREAWYEPGSGHWVFREGRETWLDPETGEVMRTMAFQEQAVPHFRELPALMLVFGSKPSDLSFFELRRLIRYHQIEGNPKVTLYAVRYYAVLAETIGPLIIIALAIPFALSGVRVNPAVGVSKSIGLFLLYFLLVRASTALGARGVVEPLWAALIPNLGMLGLGGWLLLRMR
ncbi:MAG TPA: LptF/LptG family permease, partial [Candidatus Synoicihabitans sp.]|nr:LptF/LptG family permease [Candidatus Synoicihabitans sp.]